MEETQDGSNQQAQREPYSAGEELGSPQHGHMYTDELPPSHSLCAFRSGWDIMAFENIADRLVADAIAQVGHGTGNAVIAPRAILSGHPHYQILDLLTDAGTSNRRARQGVNGLVYELTMPGEDGVGLRNRGDLCQSLLPELLPQLGEGGALGVGERHPTFNLVA